MLESDPTVPSVDDSGDQLLKHARVYTLAEKLGVPGLKTLASSKIHCVNSTAKGEIAYARYVYAYTSNDDSVIRAPVASFWATRSHTLRAEAESEFKSLCLEHPQFGYDVLSMSSLLQRTQRGTNNIQLVSWTTSSSENALIKCTPRQAATASVLVIAAGLGRLNMGRPYQLGLGTKVLDGLAIGISNFFFFRFFRFPVKSYSAGRTPEIDALRDAIALCGVVAKLCISGLRVWSIWGIWSLMVSIAKTDLPSVSVLSRGRIPRSDNWRWQGLNAVGNFDRVALYMYD